MVNAATFYLEPAAGNFIRGCNSTVAVKMNLSGERSNGAQAYVDYSGLPGGSISMGGSGLFSTYGNPSGMPAGTLGIFGYGGVVNGDGRQFATITVRPVVDGTVNLNLRFNTPTLASKIAQYPTSEDILSSVVSGQYNVIFGYCETNPPYLTSLDPVPDKPNHPVDRDITFVLRDDSSGVDINSLLITVQQNSLDLPITITKTQVTPGDDHAFNVVVNPVSNLTPELKVTVNVTAKDKANNVMNRSWSFNDLTCTQLGCAAGGVTPQCKDGIDNDSDGLIDFPADPDCASANGNSEFPAGGCTGSTTTTIFGTCPPVGGITPQCRDGIDNDGDGLIDLADSDCRNPDENSELGPDEIKQCVACAAGTTTTVINNIPGQTTTSGLATPLLALNNLSFYLANRTIEALPSAQGFVENLVNSPLTVALDVSGLNEPVNSAALRLGDKAYEMFYDNGLKKYVADLTTTAAPGVLSGSVIVNIGAEKTVSVPFLLSVLPYGVINGEADEGARPVAGASVGLEQLAAGGSYVRIKTTLTDNSGTYGFVVPNGTYRLVVQTKDYRAEQTPGFAAANHVVNRIFGLIKTVNLLDPNVPLNTKINYAAEVAQKEAGKIVEQVNNPAVQSAVQTTVAPIAVGAAAAAVVPALSLINLLSYLRFLFLQPVFLLGRRKRAKWGVVYNALTKLPVDLAVVRLVDVKTGRVVQSRVTDNNGRYAFFADPGLYRIEVNKQGFVFPTKVLQEFKEDTGFLDIYHGEPVHVDDKYIALTVNIPLDPVGATEKTPRRLAVEKFLREAQRFIASLSIVAGAVAMAISPSWWTIGLFVSQILLFYLFKRLGKAKKPKSWGIVYARHDNSPLGRVVTRLFSKQFNKLVSTEITDGKGRYSFMVGPNDYFITFEKDGFKKATSPEIKVKEKNEVIKLDVGLEKSV